MVARALAIVHTCVYDAWAAYDDRAVGTQLSGAFCRPASERTLTNKEKAISYAAYRALADVMPNTWLAPPPVVCPPIPPTPESVYKPLMQQAWL
jgi:uncharacterized protein DUF6851